MSTEVVWLLEWTGRGFCLGQDYELNKTLPVEFTDYRAIKFTSKEAAEGFREIYKLLDYTPVEHVFL